jgi:hypothetical protein
MYLVANNLSTQSLISFFPFPVGLAGIFPPASGIHTHLTFDQRNSIIKIYSYNIEKGKVVAKSDDPRRQALAV